MIIEAGIREKIDFYDTTYGTSSYNVKNENGRNIYMINLIFITVRYSYMCIRMKWWRRDATTAAFNISYEFMDIECDNNNNSHNPFFFVHTKNFCSIKSSGFDRNVWNGRVQSAISNFVVEEMSRKIYQIDELEFHALLDADFLFMIEFIQIEIFLILRVYFWMSARVWCTWMLTYSCFWHEWVSMSWEVVSHTRQIFEMLLNFYFLRVKIYFVDVFCRTAK